MGRFLPADHSKGDANTLGGYAAVHERPAAFEGVDGLSYTADIVVDETGARPAPYEGYLLFVCWGRGEPTIQGHLESDVLSRGATEDGARAEVGRMRLSDVKAVLDTLIRRRGGEADGDRPWWQAMRDEDGGEGPDGPSR